jgi:hypothetical protein
MSRLDKTGKTVEGLQLSVKNPKVILTIYKKDRKTESKEPIIIALYIFRFISIKDCLLVFYQEKN